jgi:hypothetical protein
MPNMFFNDQTANRIARQLNVIDRKLDLLMAHFGIDQPEPYPEVMRHIDAGRRLDAIKAYRAATGAGLVEAKEAVDEMTRKRGH